MSDNKINISIQIADNLIKAQKNLQNTQKEVDKLKLKLKGLEEEQKVVNSIFNEGQISQAEYNKESARLKVETDKSTNSLIEQTQALSKFQTENVTLEKTLNNTVIAEQVLNDLTNKTTLTLSEMQSQLAALNDIPLDGLNAEQIAQVGESISGVSSQIANAKVQIEGMDTSKFFENIGGGLKVVAESTNVLIEGLGALGVESETLNKLQENTNKLIGVTQSLAAITDFLVQKKHLLIAANIKNIALKVKDAIATKAQAATFLILGQSANSASIGFKVLRGALISTGIGALIVGIGMLIANFDKLINLFNKTSQTEKSLQNVQKQTIQNALDERTEFDLLTKRIEEAKNGRGDLSQALDSYNKKFGDTQKLTQDIINDEEKYNAVLEERAQLIQDQAREKALIEEIKDLKGKEAEAEKKFQILKENGAKENSRNYLNAKTNLENIRKGVGDLTAEWDKVRISIDDAVASQEKMDGDAKAEKMAVENMREGKPKDLKLLDIREKEELAAAGNSAEHKKQIEIKYQNERNAIAKKYNEKYNNDAYNAASKAVDLKLKQDEATIKAEEDYLKADFGTKQLYEKRFFDLQHNSEIEKLNAQKSFGKITEDEYNTHKDILLKSEQEFRNKQIAELRNHLENQKRQIKELIGLGIENQIEDIGNKYNDAIKSIDISADLNKSNPDEYTSNLVTVAKLEEEKEAHIAKVKKEWDEKRINDEISLFEEKYKEDFKGFENNEVQKLKLSRAAYAAMRDKLKGEGKDTSEFDKKVETFDKDIIDAELQEKISASETQAQLEIAIAKGKNAAIFDIEKKAIADKLKLLEAAGKQETLEYAETKLEQKELDDTHLAEQQEKWIAYADTMKEAFAGIFELLNTLGQADLQRAEEENNAKKESLQAQLDSGAISQREYNKKVELADKDLDKKKAELARKQAIRDKAMKAIEITINTASAIMRAWSDTGPLGGPIFSAIIGALGAVQLATVLAAPLPKAAKGGLIRGASHEGGGVVLEAEGGEFIVNKRATKANMPLLQGINRPGAIPFLNTGSDGGFAQREYQRRSPQNINYDMLAESIAGEFRNVQIYAAIEDFNDAEKKFVKPITEART